MSLHVYDVPSKCRFDLLDVTLEHIKDHKAIRTLSEEIRQHERHAQFLVQNASILGFVSRPKRKWLLTSTGEEYLRTQSDGKGLILAKAMFESRLIRSLIDIFGSFENVAKLSVIEISDFLVKNAFVSRGSTKRMTNVTADRRASSVRKWIEWLKNNIPKKVEPEFIANHTSIEWALLFLGSHSGFDTWITNSDRKKKYQGKMIGSECIPILPDLGLGQAARRIVENIDILWLLQNKVTAAFEVEHTSSITSGLNRLNDLILSSPNLNIDSYIIAPDERFRKLENELNRPTFKNLRNKVKWIPYSIVEERLDATIQILGLGGILPIDFLINEAVGI